VASYSVNERGVARARQLIEARQYVLRSEWNQVQPRAAEENAFLESHSWDEYAECTSGLRMGRRITRRPATRSSTGTFVGSTGWGWLRTSKSA
jgi:hypothetical protein